MNLLEYCHSKKKLYIYGAGILGERVYRLLRVSDIKIEAFIVSDGQNCEEYFMGIPVKKFSCARSDISDAGVLLAVSEKYIEDVETTLQSNSVRDYFIAKKQEISELMRAMCPAKNKFIECIEPIGRSFGFDRGTPIDRVYIENFLNQAIKEIPDRPAFVLEVGDDRYSRKYFRGGHSQLDVLDYGAGMDLTRPETLPVNKYDVFICTQVLNYIYEIRKAIHGAYELLKPGGWLLATVAGNIAQISRDYYKWGDYWRFTDMSIKKLMSERFDEGNVCVKNYGNAAVATAFIQGLSAEELDPSILEFVDPEYAIMISVTARK